MQSFEFMDIYATSFARYIKLVIIYRPPRSNKNTLSHADFLAECAAFIEGYAMVSCCLAMIGDFNIHWDKSSDCNVKLFADLIDPVNIIQHVCEQTHIDGHAIDLVLTGAENNGIVSTRTSLLLTDVPYA